MFTIFALQVLSDKSTGRRKLTPKKIYYFLEGFKVGVDDRLYIDNYRLENDIVYQCNRDKSPLSVNITAIVGENGSGKSSVIEFYLRLINNFAAATIGEYEVNPGAQHLHYINGIEGELYYLLDNVPYRLRIQNRNVIIESYAQIEENKTQKIFILPNTAYIFDNRINMEENVKDFTPMSSWKPSKHQLERNPIATLKDLYKHFFYTYVSNYSIYAYNTLDYKSECNSDHYEELIRKTKKKFYDYESKNWLNGIFHKNDGYQTPIVLSPFRSEGNIDINIENTLSKERLLSLLISPTSNFRIINSHLKVSGFNIAKIKIAYNAKYLKKEVGFRRLHQRGYDNLKALVLKYWSEVLQTNLLDYKDQRKAFDDAVGYLVYKTMKVSSKYKQYYKFFKNHQNIAYKVNEKQLADLIEAISRDQSHITNKIRQTLCYIITGIYEFDNDHKSFAINDVLKSVEEAIDSVEHIDGLNNIFKFPDDLIPSPFFETTIELADTHTHSPVFFETLSSGEKQQTYSISALMYHLSNLDSVWFDNNNQRIVYENVNVILEEIELYFHPEFQRTYIINILDGIRQLNLKHIKNLNICFVTHSPFILSDIPSRNILALNIDDKDQEQMGCKLQTFGANIHDMLKNSFFLKQGAMGEYARQFISQIIKQMEDMPKNENHSPDTLSQLHEKILLIDEPIVRMALLTDYNNKFPVKNEMRIKELEKQIQELKNNQ